VDDALLMRGLKSFGDLLGNEQRFIDGNRPFRDTVSERLAFDQLHDECAKAVGFF